VKPAPGEAVPKSRSEGVAQGTVAPVAPWPPVCPGNLQKNDSTAIVNPTIQFRKKGSLRPRPSPFQAGNPPVWGEGEA